MAEQRRPALFLDRDGTVCEESGYLVEVERLRLIDGSAEAIRLAREAGFLAVLVTNQSGVARGLFDVAQVERAHRRLARLLALRETALDAVYFCPHHPTSGFPPYRVACDCRKPEPGMLLAAAEALNLDLGSSFMVGDRRDDLEAGRRAGVRPILVRTGYGSDELGYHAKSAAAESIQVADDLLEAVQWILRQPQHGLDG